MAKQIVVNGRTFEVPDDVTDEELQAAAEQFDVEQTASDQADADSAYWGEMRKSVGEGVRNVGSGIVGAVTGIPGMVKEVGGIGYDALTGNASSAASRSGNMLAGIAKSFLNPVAQSARGAGALVAPESVTAPTEEEWGEAQTEAGGQLGGAVLAKVTPKITSAVKKSTSAGALMSGANKLRSIGKTNVNIPGAPKTAAAVNAAGTVARGAAKPVAKGMELAAKARAKLDKAPAFKEAAPKVSNEMPFEGIPEEAVQDPFMGEMRPSAGARQDIEFGGFPDEQAPMYQEPAPLGLQEIPFEYAPEEFAPKPMSDAPTPMQIRMAEEAQAPSGKYRQQGTIRHTEELLKIAPELRNIGDTARWDKTLYQSFKNAEAGVDAAEASVPRTTTVAQQPILDNLRGLQAEYALKNNVPAMNTISKLIDSFEERFKGQANIPWEEFLQVKRNFMKQGRAASNSASRRAYGKLMAATDEISPSLTKANKVYSTIMRGLENSGIDPVSGRRLSTVGKPVEAPGVGREGKSGFRLPL